MDGYIKVNGTQLYYEIAGEGEILVLLHSGYTDSRLWDEQFDLFARYFKVIRYDIRGFGKSDKPCKPFSHIDDLHELLTQLGVLKTHLLGVSMGGSIAIDFTLQYPDMVNCLILSGPSLSGYKPAMDEASQLRSLAGISIAKRDDNYNQSIEFMLNDPMWRQTDPTAYKNLRNMFISTSLDWLLNNLVQNSDTPAVKRLCEIRSRALLIIGTNDSLPIKEIAEVLKSNISTIETIEIKDTGHLPNLDKPEIFNKAVLDFLFDN